MNTTQRTLDLITRPKLRLSEVERLIRINRIIVPPLSRRSLIDLCEEGKLQIAPRKGERSPYLVYEDSFLAWVRSLDEPA
jgi:hypothetical protein